MDILVGLWQIARGIYTVVKGVGRAFVAIAGWAVANPLGAILVGTGLLLGSYWLRNQPWAGADALAALVGWAGEALLWTGIGVFAGKLFARTVGKYVREAFAFLKSAVQAPRKVMPWRSLFGPGAVGPLL